MTPNDARLAAGLARWLNARRGWADVSVDGLERPTEGYSSETVFCDATWRSGTGEHRSRLVVRMAPPRDGSFPTYDLTAQGQAQLAAAAVGVPVADPVVETDADWVGTPFMVMDRVDGHLVGSLVHADRWLRSLDRSDQREIYLNFLTVMSDIQRADPGPAPAVPRRDNLAELEFWDEYLSWSSGGHPAPPLVEALGWCRSNRPSDEPPAALLWGDARFENAVFGDDLAVRAVLDWDMTAVGAPEHDLAWLTALDLTMHHLFGERIGGFPDRGETVALFEELIGRPVQALDWYETLAMVRSAAIMNRIGYLHLAAGQRALLPPDDNPILDLLTSRLP